MTAIVVGFDVLHGHGRSNIGLLVKIPDVPGQVGVVIDTAKIAFEMAEIHGVEANEGCEQAPICFSDLGAEQVSGVVQLFFQPIEGFEQWDNGFFIGGLSCCESRFVNTVVDRVVNAFVDLVDFGSERCRIIVTG